MVLLFIFLKQMRRMRLALQLLGRLLNFRKNLNPVWKH